MQHRLHRDTGDLQVDSDLWLCALDLALALGWAAGVFAVFGAVDRYLVDRDLAASGVLVLVVGLLVSITRAGQVVLLENLRFHAGETDNDPDFVSQLARLTVPPRAQQMQRPRGFDRFWKDVSRTGLEPS